MNAFIVKEIHAAQAELVRELQDNGMPYDLAWMVAKNKIRLEK